MKSAFVSCVSSRCVGGTAAFQVLRWSFLALRGDFNVNLTMTEEPRKMQITTEMMQVRVLVYPQI